MRNLLVFILLILSRSLFSSECNLNSPIRNYHPRYAKHFKIDYFKNFKRVHVDDENYFLISSPPECTLKESGIVTPVKTVAMMSTTYLPALELLKKEQTLIGFQGKRYIVSNAFDLRKIQDISYKFNPEGLLNLKADLIMGYTSNFLDSKQQKILRMLKLPIVINKDFEEKNPLARAEWIVFISSFYNQEEEAIKIFNSIEEDYLKIKKGNLAGKKINVLVGEIESGDWETCGGESDLAQLIADAGGNLAFSKATPATQKINLEELIKSKIHFDVWLTHNLWESSQERMKALERDQRYQFISATSVYNNNLIMNKYKATDYWESALQRPDLLLRDLTFVFHPEKIPGHKLRWYKKI